MREGCHSSPIYPPIDERWRRDVSWSLVNGSDEFVAFRDEWLQGIRIRDSKYFEKIRNPLIQNLKFFRFGIRESKYLGKIRWPLLKILTRLIQILKKFKDFVSVTQNILEKIRNPSWLAPVINISVEVSRLLWKIMYILVRSDHLLTLVRFDH